MFHNSSYVTSEDEQAGLNLNCTNPENLLSRDMAHLKAIQIKDIDQSANSSSCPLEFSA